ncbi:hypothetical protein DFP72DRAFT_915787 [Ephemerocybe angulata]|uniref:Uncharacterized protein n=1 Tax=Ephemerocybe angulata TaxID=980116 RepID=A0A8H6HM08_9AGAR|nr:hypothetical protein DFP72DRAFT_915787 [Tulosesus angulatus]
MLSMLTSFLNGGMDESERSGDRERVVRSEGSEGPPLATRPTNVGSWEVVGVAPNRIKRGDRDGHSAAPPEGEAGIQGAYNSRDRTQWDRSTRASVEESRTTLQSDSQRAQRPSSRPQDGSSNIPRPLTSQTSGGRRSQAAESVENPYSKPSSTSQDRDRIRTLEQQMAAMEAIIKEQHDSLRRKDGALSEMHARNGDWERRYGWLQSELSGARLRADKQFGELSGRCRELEDELMKAKALLDARTQELKVSQAFITTADQYSIADISRMVEQLNEEIFNFAMNISDAVFQSTTNTQVDETIPGYIEAHQAAVRRWGESTILRLRADFGKDAPDTILFESLIQHVLVCWCYEIIQPFNFVEDDMGTGLDQIWKGIIEKHETAVAKNWLSMTSSELPRPDSIRNDSILKKLKDLMIASGWRENGESARLMTTTCENLDEIMKKAIGLRDAVVHGVLSVEVEIIRANQGIQFNPATMQDAFDIGQDRNAGVPERQMVLCGTSLGIWCVRRNKSASTSGNQRMKEVVLRAKVLLPSAL